MSGQYSESCQTTNFMNIQFFAIKNTFGQENGRHWQIGETFYEMKVTCFQRNLKRIAYILSIYCICICVCVNAMNKLKEINVTFVLFLSLPG